MIEKNTPKTVSFKIESEIDFDEVMSEISVFGDNPLILKDFVKSRKHEWNEACFIPSASNRQEVERVVNKFIELQGEDLNEGLVFREFIEFQPLVAHSKSKMPLTKEFRLFFLDGELFDYFNYWEEGDYGEIKPPEHIFSDVAGKIQSRFFTMDIAQTISGEWLIVELGDGQVAGLPDNADVENFYRKLRSKF
ncbi:MAG: ATP-grasp domain-containing protein [Acidobacteriota bacterium]